MRGRDAWACHFALVVFDIEDMTLTLEILWRLLCPTYLYYIGQFGVVGHGHFGSVAFYLAL